MNHSAIHLKQQIQQYWPALLIALFFLILAVTYSVVTPIFESPDELWHYPFVWHVAQTGQLPVQNSGRPQLWAHEGSQAPLYYLLAGLLTAPIPADDLPLLFYHNPHADIGRVSPDRNVNIVVHTARESWPWTGAVLAVHIARFFSVLLSVGTVLSIYALGRVLWPERPTLAWLAMAFVAFNPMFIFISGSVSNDTMITLMASLSLWQLAALLTLPDKEPPFRRFISLGVLAGLAALSKLSGLGLIALLASALFWQGIRRRSWRMAVFGNGVVISLAVVIAGWWYWRNFILYGDWKGIQPILAMLPPRQFTPTAAQWLVEAAGLLRSFWGVFGYFSILMPAPIYWLLNSLLVIGGVGLLAALVSGQAKKWPSRLRLMGPILLLWLGLMVAGLIHYTVLIPSSQGRLLFPALVALAILWAAGWTTLVPRRGHLIFPLLMVPLAAWVPWGVIVPAYASPTSIAALPPSTQPLGVMFGDRVTLLGYETTVSQVRPGEQLPLTLYWRGEQTTTTDYSVFVHLVNEYDLIVAQRDVFHGPGVYPTSQWPAGRQFGDTYVLQLPGTAFAPTHAHFEVGLYQHETGQRLPVSSGGDSVRFGQIAVVPHPGLVPNPQLLRFTDGITLIGYALDKQQVAQGKRFTLTLYWQVWARPAQNYRVFAHLVNQNGALVAQHDGEPQEGAAPTGDWTPGQVIVDQFPLTVAPNASPGAYRLLAGLYDDTGQRLQLTYDGSGLTQVDTVTLGKVRVVSP